MAKLINSDGISHFWSIIKGKLNGKVDKIEGKGLSTNDYTTDEKNKLAGIEAGANKTIIDSELSSTSSNPVQNSVVKSALDGKADTNHGIHVIAGGSAGQVLKKTTSGYEWATDNDTIYTHPETHPATMITSDETHRFVTDTEKATWNSKANGTHTHAISDVTDLQNALDSKSDDGHAHAWEEITGKPATFTPSSHTHAQSEVVGLETALAGKSDTGHGHVIGDVTGLQGALDAKLDSSTAESTYAKKSDITNVYKYKGSVATVSDLPASGNTAGDVYNVEERGINYAWTGTVWDNLGEVFTFETMTNEEIDAICV